MRVRFASRIVTRVFMLLISIGLTDPANSVTEDDGNGHIDSVIVIKPK